MKSRIDVYDASCLLHVRFHFRVYNNQVSIASEIRESEIRHGDQLERGRYVPDLPNRETTEMLSITKERKKVEKERKDCLYLVFTYLHNLFLILA